MKRNGSGSHRRLRWPTHGSADQVGARAEHQVGQRAPGDVRGGDAVAGVAAGPADARRGS